MKGTRLAVICFSLAVENGSIVLALHGNTWKLVPR